MATRRNLSSAPQLELFRAPAEDPLAVRYAALKPVADKLSPLVHFGTSSWSFPGWAGIVYPRKLSESVLAREGLRDYARHPLLRTVGIDRGYYAPIPTQDLDLYASQLPSDFLCCTKAPERLTAPVHLGHGRGEKGAPNDDFLSPERFMEWMGTPFLTHFAAHSGPFMFEFPPVPRQFRLDPAHFAEQLDFFFSHLPNTLQYAVELRDRALMTPDYLAVLQAHGVAHVYNYWSQMPMPAVQAKTLPIESMPFVIVRLLLRPGTKYEQQKEAFAPFDKLVEPDADMRRDVLDLLREAMRLGKKIFVLVNNKAEGSSPLTIEDLARMLVGG